MLLDDMLLNASLSAAVLSLQVCPITLTLFQDPVCNALGQVYERAALQRHLLQVNCSCSARMQWPQQQPLVQGNNSRRHPVTLYELSRRQP